jgi:hypothetical protein
LQAGFDRVIRAVVNYVRALPSIDDFDKIGNDVFGSEKDQRIRKLRESVKYYQVTIFDKYQLCKYCMSQTGHKIFLSTAAEV